MTLPESDELRAQYEADAYWMTVVADQLAGILDEAKERPRGYQAFVGGLMTRYGRDLTESAYRGLA